MSPPIPQIPMSVGLRRLFPFGSFVGCADVRVADATANSRECAEDMLFAAINGSRADGNKFIGEAIKRGASSLLVENPLAGAAVPQCVVPNVRKAYAELCAALAGSPSQRLKIAAVTGTNGKTTVTWLLRSIFQAAGKQAGLLGTIEYSDGVAAERAGLTTPDSKTLSQWLQCMVSRGTTHAAIELSSHALDQERPAGTLLEAAIVTNVTQDHFDYHSGHESYRASKARIFKHVKKSGLAVLNADDPVCASFADEVSRDLKVCTYGIEAAADVTATHIDASRDGTAFTLNFDGIHIDVRTELVGRHNVSNCLAASAAAIHLGVDLETIAAGIEALISVPGRLERVNCGQAFDVFVDYAHTDDALRRCIRFLDELSRGRVICVFGAGGDRDRSKRPLMGQAAAEADRAVITSDNPRTEDPARIIQEILPGFSQRGIVPHVEIDRAEAIRWALEHANPGDCVLIAGKGHETEQIVGTRRIPFDDRAVIRDCLETRAFRRADNPLRIPA